MKTKLAFAGILLFLLLYSAPALPQCHGNSSGTETSNRNNSGKFSQHGGKVKQAGRQVYIEMVFDPFLVKDPISFYTVNKKGKPITNQEIDANATITYNDGSTEIVKLSRKGVNGFGGQMAKKDMAFTCIITLEGDRRTITTGFQATSPLQAGDEKAVYSCPMHREVKSDEPGVCPKCGMSLKEL